MGTFITAATIMAIYLNSAGNLDSRYCYNADVENGRVMTMYVYDKQGLALSGKMEHRYEYDAQGRVTAKETYRRDAVTGRMKPHSRLDYTYTADGYTVERSLWNSGTGAFDRAAEILRADKKKYCDLVGKMIASSAEDGDKVRVSEADKEVLDKAFVESVAKKRKIKITLDKEYAPIKGGVILVGKNYDKNLSLDLELQTLREECEGEVAKVLFGE